MGLRMSETYLDIMEVHRGYTIPEGLTVSASILWVVSWPIWASILRSDRLVHITSVIVAKLGLRQSKIMKTWGLSNEQGKIKIAFPLGQLPSYIYYG